MTKIFSNIALTVMCMCAVAFVTMPVQAAGTEPIKVGTDQTYPTLNAAITAAQEGQIIQIIGEVTETKPANPVVINKRVTIQGNGPSAYKIAGWTNPASPFQITAEGVVIENLEIDINGGATTYPLMKTGKNLSLNNVSINLTGTSTAAAAPISVGESGLKMKQVYISNATRATKILDLQGYSANLKGVSIAAGAGVTGIYSETSPEELILEDCDFQTKAGTARAISLPSPAGLTLTGCDFSYTGAGTGAGNLGLLFGAPSGVSAKETLTASGCTFNMKSGTGISLNGYNASFASCEFIFDANSGKGINSETPSDAELIFTGCGFYVGKTAGAKITGANCIVLKGNTGDIKINKCEIVASDPSINLTTPSTIVINAPDSKLNSLTVSNSDFSFNVGAASAVGVNVDEIENLIVTGANFIVDASNVKCINTGKIETGLIRNSNFTVGAASSAATGVVCINVPSAENLIIDDSSSFTINTKSTGIIAGVKNLIMKDSGFYVDAGSAKGISVNGVETGSISNCKFDIKNANAVGVGIINFSNIDFTGNTFNLSTGGRGINMTTSSGDAAGDVVIDSNTITITGDATIVGLLFEHLNFLSIKNTTLKTPGETSASITCIRGNHIKAIEIDNVYMGFDSTTANGIIINEKKPPLGEEAKITITNTTANLKAATSRAIRIFYANGVLVDNYSGTIEAAATGSYLLFLQNSKNVEVRNCNYEAQADGARFLTFTSNNSTSEESSDFNIHHNILTIKNGAGGIIAAQANHNVYIHENSISIDNAAKGVVIAYGRNNNVYGNIFNAVNCGSGIVSDGVDEISSFTMDVDKDIYDANGNVIDAYRNKIYNNKFTGSYEYGLYISNNGDVASDNDFSEAAFQYESIPGTIRNTQIIVSYCKDVKILNNKFAKARSSDKQVVRINNAIISEVTGNITQPVDGASEVLFVQGATALAPSGIKYPESITFHNPTNTINGMAPVEVIKEWDDPDNLIYEYILQMPEPLPPSPQEPDAPSPQSRTQSRDMLLGLDDAYFRAKEASPGTAPEIVPHPRTGKSEALSPYIWVIPFLIIVGLRFFTGHKRKRGNDNS